MGISLSRLPSLGALAELHVTPGAVSQQIKQLEDQLGCELFRRSNRVLTLTNEGQACLPGLTEAFERIVTALENIKATTEGGILTVSVAPSFAAKWLVPRLEDFRSAHPDIDVRVAASMQLVDFEVEDVDCAIRYGAGDYPGLFSEQILGETVFPVCSPNLTASGGPPATPQDLARFTLLHDDSPDQDQSCPDWTMWLRAAGVDGVDAARGLRFNQSNLVLEAAIASQGIALAKGQLAADDVRAGRLRRPFSVAHKLDFAYHLVCPKRKTSVPRVVAFLRWLRSQADYEARVDASLTSSML